MRTNDPLTEALSAVRAIEPREPPPTPAHVALGIAAWAIPLVAAMVLIRKHLRARSVSGAPLREALRALDADKSLRGARRVLRDYLAATRPHLPQSLTTAELGARAESDGKLADWIEFLRACDDALHTGAPGPANHAERSRELLRRDQGKGAP